MVTFSEIIERSDRTTKKLSFEYQSSEGFLVKVYYLDGLFVVISFHDGKPECEGGYLVDEFEDFKRDFGIKG